MSRQTYYNVEWLGGEFGGLTLNLPSCRGVMDYQVEMAANNDIEGLCAFSEVVEDGKPRFRYDTDGFSPLESYIAENGADIRLVAEVLMGVSTVMSGLEKYLLEEKCALLRMDLVFLDPARHSVKLVYLPVEPPDDELSGFSEFVTELLKNTDPRDTTDRLFRRRIMDEIRKIGFRYEAFSEFLLDIICFQGDKDTLNSGVDVNSAASAGVKFPAFSRKTPGENPLKKMSGNQKTVDDIIKPALCAIVVLVAYFGINQVLRGAYMNAVLLVAVAAQMLLLRLFMTDGRVTRKQEQKRKPENERKPKRMTFDTPKEKLGGKPIERAVAAARIIRENNDTESLRQPQVTESGNIIPNGHDNLWEDSILEPIPPTAANAASLSCCPATEILSDAREISAKLLIKDSKREYGVLLKNSEFTIGRQTDSVDLALENPAVGKLHAKLEFKENTWFIQDLFSRNGTYLNNIRIDGDNKKRLSCRDIITIANIDIIFEC